LPPHAAMSADDEDDLIWPTNKRGYEILGLIGEVRVPLSAPPPPP
jgi:hypothetical protein